MQKFGFFSKLKTKHWIAITATVIIPIAVVLITKYPRSEAETGEERVAPLEDNSVKIEIDSSHLESSPVIVGDNNTASVYNDYRQSFTTINKHYYIASKPETLESAQFIVEDQTVTTRIFQGAITFVACNAGGSRTLRFSSAHREIGQGVEYRIHWGDGGRDSVFRKDQPQISFQHTFPEGNSIMVVETVLPDGRKLTKNYNVYVGVNPNVALIPSQTTLCLPAAITFNILNLPQNSPGTIYTFHVTDGSPDITWVSNPPAAIGHTFTKPNRPPIGVKDSELESAAPYEAILIVENPCAKMVYTTSPIWVRGCRK